MTLQVQVLPLGDAGDFERDRVVSIGRGRTSDVCVGQERVQGRWTVSKNHLRLEWDGSRWSTLNVSDKAGLLRVYEPGYEEVPLESGRVWTPVRHRWSYSIGRPGSPFHVVCVTDDHRGPAGIAGMSAAAQRRLAPGGGGLDEEPTAGLEGVLVLSLTPLELGVLFAYYADFALLPRPPTLAPRSHDEAARRLRRSTDSTRKAIERVNEKISRFDDAPAIATGRNVSGEIGRWLARTGVLDSATAAGQAATENDDEEEEEP
jgi:hypothetical protein